MQPITEDDTIMIQSSPTVLLCIYN